MKTRLTPYYVNLVYDACLKSFWRKRALSKFLRQCGVADTFINGWDPQESKREFLDRLFAELPKSDRGRSALLRMATFLMDQDSFPDLQGWEDSELKFTAEQASAPDIDSFYKKITSKADNTMGIMVSISVYSSVALEEASGNKTPLLFLIMGISTWFWEV